MFTSISHSTTLTKAQSPLIYLQLVVCTVNHFLLAIIKKYKYWTPPCFLLQFPCFVSMSPPKSFPNGKPPPNTRQLNQIYSTIIPPSESNICRSIHDFTRCLLNINPKDENWQVSPSDQDLKIATEIPHDTSLLPITSLIAYPPPAKREQKIPTSYRTLYLNEIKALGLLSHSFAWELDWDHSWNQLILTLIMKHWKNAHSQKAFQIYYLNPADVDADNHFSILHRWFCGKRDQLRLGHLATPKVEKKKSSRKRTDMRKKVCNPLY